MNFWSGFQGKQKRYSESITECPKEDVNFVVVIPGINEPELIKTIDSLASCKPPSGAVEIICVVNSPENANQQVLDQNRKTLKDIRDWAQAHPFSFFKLHALHARNLPVKDAGAGLARKIGMDEAIRRFIQIQNENGVIISLDADSSVKTNYFTEIEKFFREKPDSDGCNIYFEHPDEGGEFQAEVYEGIVQYELFLRYFVQSLREIHYPFSFHTIGSAFAVKASAYVRQGGMNKRTAGEDFYFLQKLIPHGHFYELNTTSVYPSPRVSERVPFGTGAAMKEYVQKKLTDLPAYHPKAFDEIESFLGQINMFYSMDGFVPGSIVKDKCLRNFLESQNFSEKIAEIKSNSKGLPSFRKRFFAWFNAFRVFKFLNFAHERCYQKVPVQIAARKLLEKMEIMQPDTIKNIDLLDFYRKLQREHNWIVKY